MLNIVTNPTVLYTIINMKSMTNYPPKCITKFERLEFSIWQIQPNSYPKITIELKAQIVAMKRVIKFVFFIVIGRLIISLIS